MVVTVGVCDCVLVCDGDTEGVDEPLADGVPEGDGVVEGDDEGETEGV